MKRFGLILLGMILGFGLAVLGTDLPTEVEAHESQTEALCFVTNEHIVETVSLADVTKFTFAIEESCGDVLGMAGPKNGALTISYRVPFTESLGGCFYDDR